MKRLIYRGYHLHERDDGRWNIHKPEGNVVATEPSENDAMKWVDTQKRARSHD